MSSKKKKLAKKGVKKWEKYKSPKNQPEPEKSKSSSMSSQKKKIPNPNLIHHLLLMIHYQETINKNRI